jgi:pyrroline-5-carboxylate reductase
MNGMKVLFIGCGNMGRAIADGMLSRSIHANTQITALVPPDSGSIEDLKEMGMEIIHELQDHNSFDVVVWAVKPQVLDQIIAGYQGKFPTTSLMLSIAAGKTLNYFSEHFPDNAIVRTMPNLNAMVGQSITGCIANRDLSEEQTDAANSIISAVGEVVWVQDEDQIDAITAISGSGPAYFFYFVELLEKAAKDLGLDPEVAAELALYTFVGSAETLIDADKAAGDLRTMVTSKGGTTDAALKSFEASGLGEIVKKATKAEYKRAKELQ